MSKVKDLTGKKFGKLEVIKRMGTDKFKHSTWLCKCDCGKIKIISANNLQKGTTKSCGCLAKELLSKKMTKHNMYGTRIYRIWLRMKNRCNNSNDEHYKNYGNRGIKVCNEWNNNKNGFTNFYNWATNNGYKDDLTIDRINVNGNYEPSNCRWITMFEQQSNKRTNCFIEYYGKKYTVSQLSRLLNINKTTLRNRIKCNWKEEELGLSTNYDRYKRVRKEE